MEQTVRSIIDKGIKTVIAVTGGGAGVLELLTQYGGASSIFLAGLVPWDQNALEKFIRGKPDKYCSEATARAMAVAAFEEASKLSGHNRVIGIGLTCKLATLNEREGRNHVIYVAVQTYYNTTSYTLELKASRSRQEESYVAGQLAAHALAKTVGVKSELDLPEGEKVQVKQNYPEDGRMMELWNGHSSFRGLELPLVGSVSGAPTHQPKVIMAASFNPLHAGHKKVMRVAHELTGEKITLELCLTNADKPRLDYLTAGERIKDLDRRLTDEDRQIVGGLFVSTCGTFLEKTAIFPEAMFIVGADTYNRIGDPKFYANDADLRDMILQNMARQKTRFLVFQRKGVTLRYANETLRNMSTIVPADIYEDEGHSSTQERKNAQ